MRFLSLIALVLLYPVVSIAQQTSTEGRLLRFPAVNEKQVVFSYAGDLYSVDRKGGVARKLTSHVGYEMFPKFSHDGQQLAFTAQYDGNTEVYLMPSNGGEVQRITYTATLGRDDVADRMGPNNIVMAWTPDDQGVVYRSRRYTFNSFKGRLFKAPVSGDLSEELPFSVGGWCSYNEDGTKLAYNQVFREFRTWKYYEGGMADDVWIYDTKTEETVNITNNKAQDIFPMYYKDKVYYLSDRDRTMNLFEYDTQTKQTKKVTDFTDFDIKFPSLGKDAIAFEKGGYLFVYNLLNGQIEEVKVQFAEDLVSGRNRRVDASENITSWSLSNDGSRLLLSARGDVFTVPVKSGVTRNLTNSSGAHDRDARWSPDGMHVAFISDRSGEDELYVQKQDGASAAKALTKGGTNYKYGPTWSKDGKYLMFSDREQHMKLIEVSSGKEVVVFKSDQWELNDFDFSPDSKWIAYTRSQIQGNNTVWLYNIANKKHHQVTDHWYNSGSPHFSADGKHLYFVSMRDFNALYSNTEWNHAYYNMAKVYVLTLSATASGPFELQNDEVESGEAATVDELSERGTQIDLDGLKYRVEALPIASGSYWGLNPVKGGVYYNTYSLGDKGATLKYFDLAGRKEKTIGNYSGYWISDNEKKIAVRKGKNIFVENLTKGKLEPKNKVDLSQVTMMIDQAEEWEQIFNEAWRVERDFFYDPNMHGVDWEAMKKKYAALLPFVNHRNDLNYVIGEMIGELNIGHAYVGGGDRPEVETVKMGLLGARYSRHESGFYKIEHILQGENWSEKLRSPLQAVGLNINKGDYIIAINGASVKDMSNLHKGLIGTADQIIELTVNTKPSADGARTVLVKPIADESELYYFEWVEGNIKKVNEMSNGQIGYLHIPDMATHGLNEFARYFYPQLDKKAIIIDDRGNGGGNVSPMIIERLRRELSMVRQVRNSDAPRTKPAQILNGPKVCLINQYSASDGDLFPYQFRFYGIGKLIGVRTWGGVVGIRGSRPFIDGGYLRVPEFSHYALDGSDWVIEGTGVSPDIEVRNDPHDEYQGQDDQLNKAIEHLLEEIKTKYKEIPGPPPFPNKTN